MVTKNYIAAAALLAAGTALANAATVLTTTFANCAQETATSVTLSNAGLSGVTASVTSLVDKDGSTLGLQTIGTAGAIASLFTPNINVGNGNPWTATFTYNLGGNSLTVDSITLNVGLPNASGAWQNSARAATITATLSDETGSNTKTFTVTDHPFANSPDASSQEVTLNSDGSASTFSGSNVTLTLKVERATNETNGFYLGLNGIAYNNSAIPEPSAFGLLAGLGALALVASRRRRK